MYSRIIHGDAFNELDKLEPESVDCVFTSPDPPDNHDKMIRLVEIINKTRRVLKPTGSLFVQLGDYHDDSGDMMLLPETFAMLMKRHHWILRSKLCWHRPYNTLELILNTREDLNRFKRDWETLFFYTKDKDGYYFSENTQNTATSVFRFPYIEPERGVFASGFPEGLVQLAIDTAVPPGGTVLDPFTDSATTGLVALKNKRNFIGIEIVEEKIAKIAKRLRVTPHVLHES